MDLELTSVLQDSEGTQVQRADLKAFLCAGGLGAFVDGSSQRFVRDSIFPKRFVN